MSRTRWLAPPGAIALGLAFVLLAILNSGGYQYGASDQAFYVPAVLAHLQPELFPRDRMLILAQEQLTAFGELVAWAASASGWPLPSLFFLAHLATLAVLAGAYMALGRLLFRSWWTVAAFLFLMTLRHRISRTGVNTLEGYFHPRLLALGVGAAALAAFLRGRTWLAMALVGASALVHPTTALWFATWIGVAVIVSEPRWRRAFTLGGAAAAAVGAWLATAGAFRGRLVIMDAAWLAALARKDYLFPSDWPWWAWANNLGYLVPIALIFFARRKAGVARPRETGLVAGCAALCLVFLAALPFIEARLALAVQLQVPRVFLLLELTAALYLTWLLAEGARWTRGAAPHRAALAACVVLGAASMARGVYVMRYEHPERRVIEVGLPDSPWRDANAWVRGNTPPDSHVLADPGHAWRYGSSVRVAAERDVYLEEVKDSAVAMYSREVALRVEQRRHEAGDFAEMNERQILALAGRWDLDYLIVERRLDLPLAYANERFRVYELR